jgi:hypothetical protein
VLTRVERGVPLPAKKKAAMEGVPSLVVGRS